MIGNAVSVIAQLELQHVLLKKKKRNALINIHSLHEQVETVNAETAQMMKPMSLKKNASQILLICTNILLL